MKEAKFSQCNKWSDYCEVIAENARFFKEKEELKNEKKVLHSRIDTECEGCEVIKENMRFFKKNKVLESENKALLEEVTRTKNKRNIKLYEEKCALEKEIKKLKIRHKAKLIKGFKDRTELREEIKKQKNAVIEMVAYTKKIEMENFDLEKEIKDSKDTNKNEINYRNELIAANDDLKAENEDLEGDLCDLRGENSEYISHNNELIAENEELKSENEVLNKSIQEVTRSNLNLRSDNTKARTEISKDELRYRNELRTELRQIEKGKELLENAADYWMKHYKEEKKKGLEHRVALREEMEELEELRTWCNAQYGTIDSQQKENEKLAKKLEEIEEIASCH